MRQEMLAHRPAEHTDKERHGMAGTNYSKNSILGALEEDTLDIIFSRTYKSENTIRMIDHCDWELGEGCESLGNRGVVGKFGKLVARDPRTTIQPVGDCQVDT